MANKQSKDKKDDKKDEKKKDLGRKEYEAELDRLQVQLSKLQDWVKYRGLRVIVVFEGRDAAGKGGTIRALTERVSPRVFRVVALPAPSDREKTQMYMRALNLRMAKEIPEAVGFAFGPPAIPGLGTAGGFTFMKVLTTHEASWSTRLSLLPNSGKSPSV